MSNHARALTGVWEVTPEIEQERGGEQLKHAFSFQLGKQLPFVHLHVLQVFEKELYNFESFYKCIQRPCIVFSTVII
jgi:hypothetical protein